MLWISLDAKLKCWEQENSGCMLDESIYNTILCWNLQVWSPSRRADCKLPVRATRMTFDNSIPAVVR